VDRRKNTCTIDIKVEARGSWHVFTGFVLFANVLSHVEMAVGSDDVTQTQGQTIQRSQCD